MLQGNSADRDMKVPCQNPSEEFYDILCFCPLGFLTSRSKAPSSFVSNNAFNGTSFLVIFKTIYVSMSRQRNAHL